MAKRPYIPPTIEIEPKQMEQRKGNAHLKLPFGLCKKYGISLPESATPRDAWNALKGIGIVPSEEYDKFAEQQVDNESADKSTDTHVTKHSGEVDKLFSDSNRFEYNGTFTKEYVKSQFDVGDQYHKDIVKKAMEETRISYRHGKSDECFSYMGRVMLTVDPDYGGKDSSYEKGEVFYHESFHAIDGGYASLWGTMLSHTYKNEEGKTLYDVLKSEKRAFGAAGIAEIKAARDKELDEWLIKNGITTAEKIQNTEKRWKEQMERLNSTWVYDERRSIADSDEFNKAKIAHSTLEAQRMVYRKKLNKKYGFISDILSQWNESLGMGHTMSYWKKDKYNSSSEFFAEVGACGATNKEALEVVRKYFPKSVKLAQQIIDDIKNGKIKAR